MELQNASIALTHKPDISKSEERVSLASSSPSAPLEYSLIDLSLEEPYPAARPTVPRLASSSRNPFLANIELDQSDTSSNLREPETRQLFLTTGVSNGTKTPLQGSSNDDNPFRH